MPGVWQLPMKYIHFYRIGSEKKNSVPLPGSVMNPILPSWASTIFLTISRLKAGAALFLRGRLDRCCPEGLEEFVLFLFRDAGALVGNGDDNFVVLPTHAHRNICARLGILHRVGQKIVHHLLNSAETAKNCGNGPPFSFL